MMTAARIGDLDAVKMLLDRGAMRRCDGTRIPTNGADVCRPENHPAVVQLLVVERHATSTQRPESAVPRWVLQTNSGPPSDTESVSFAAVCPIAVLAFRFRAE